MTPSRHAGPHSPDPDHDQLRIDLAGYLLDALEPADHQRLQAHLRQCEACRAELAELADLPSALGLLNLTDLIDLTEVADLTDVTDLAGVTDPADLGRDLTDRERDQDPADRALVSLAAHRRSIRRRVGSAVAGIAVAAALVVGVTILNQPSSLRVTARGGAVTASVKLTDNAGGSAVLLRLNGVPPHQVCALVAVDTSGRRQTAATWVANYDGEAVVHGQSGISTARLASLTVLGTRGVPLVTLPIKHT